jgi:hypothetical protein
MKTHISDGNDKIGNMPNVSLAPCKGCGPDAPCKKDCYAMKAYRMYPSTKVAWDDNLGMANKDRDAFFADIDSFLAGKRKAPRFFRWHVAGDIQDADYLRRMIAIAKKFPETKFLAFTKRHDIIKAYKGDVPENMEIVLSMWPGFGDTKMKRFRRAWMQDGTETRIPSDALECAGFCETCGMCWNLNKIGRDVFFEKH